MAAVDTCWQRGAQYAAQSCVRAWAPWRDSDEVASRRGDAGTVVIGCAGCRSRSSVRSHLCRASNGRGVRRDALSTGNVGRAGRPIVRLVRWPASSGPRAKDEHVILLREGSERDLRLLLLRHEAEHVGQDQYNPAIGQRVSMTCSAGRTTEQCRSSATPTPQPRRSVAS